MRFPISLIFLALSVQSAPAQWATEESKTTVDLHGIHNAGDGIAWASGAQGTILRTVDDGKTWQRCATPPNAERLDFRAIQAFDEKTAIVMSSGRGDQSRLYKTTDGCVTWSLILTNPDTPDGSFSGIQFTPGNGREKGRVGHLIGEPVNGLFAEYITYDGGNTWRKFEGPWRASARRGETLLAASNSAFLEIRGGTLFVTGGRVSRSRTLEMHVKDDPRIFLEYVGGDIPLQLGASAGADSVAVRLAPDSVAEADRAQFIERVVHAGDTLVAVGGDSTKPEDSRGTCAFSLDGSLHWSSSTAPPHGYRSSVAYDANSNVWITVGPSGTDISSDDGRNWRRLKPSPGEPTDADKNWNALSLPFVVGSGGRIGKLLPDHLK